MQASGDVDFIYSISLLVSLMAGSVGVLIGLLATGRRGSGARIIRACLSAIAVALLGLVISVVVHWHRGHGPDSPEPMGVARFASSHAAFLVAIVLIGVGLSLVLFAKRRRAVG